MGFTLNILPAAFRGEGGDCPGWSLNGVGGACVLGAIVREGALVLGGGKCPNTRKVIAKHKETRCI